MSPNDFNLEDHIKNLPAFRHTADRTEEEQKRKIDAVTIKLESIPASISEIVTMLDQEERQNIEKKRNYIARQRKSWEDVLKLRPSLEDTLDLEATMWRSLLESSNLKQYEREAIERELKDIDEIKEYGRLQEAMSSTGKFTPPNPSSGGRKSRRKSRKSRKSLKSRKSRRRH
jgi:hypothetical protein